MNPKGRNPGATLMFPSASGELGYGTMFNFKSHSFDLSGSKSNLSKSVAKETRSGAIMLPLPQNLTEVTGMSYDGAELGLAGAAALGGQALKEHITKSGMSGVMGEIAKGGLKGAGYWARSVGQALGDAGKVLNLAAGDIPNPFMTTVFRGVTPRTHNLTWKLVPMNEQDSKNIKRIIDTFKFHSLPARDGLFLTMPSQVDVHFFGSAYLYGFGTCVIENIQVNYAPQNVPSFFKGSQGAPTSVEFTLSMREVETLTRSSFGKPPYGNSDDPSSFSPLTDVKMPSAAERAASAAQQKNVNTATQAQAKFEAAAASEGAAKK